MTTHQQPIHEQTPSNGVELSVKRPAPDTDECINILRNGLTVFSQRGLPHNDDEQERFGRIVTMSRFDDKTFDLVDLRQLRHLPVEPKRIPITYVALDTIDANATRPIVYTIDETQETEYAILDVATSHCIVLEASVLVDVTLMSHSDDEATRRLLNIVHVVIEYTWF